jgi:hypothetical protein
MRSRLLNISRYDLEVWWILKSGYALKAEQYGFEGKTKRSDLTPSITDQVKKASEKTKVRSSSGCH